MKKFILGYKDAMTEVTNDGRNLTVYDSIEDANANSEEWCHVEAISLEEAKLKYEKTFEKLKKEGKIFGPF